MVPIPFGVLDKPGARDKNAGMNLQNALPYIVGIATFALMRALGSHSIAIAAGGAVGFVCGLVPYFLFKKKIASFATASLWVCAVSGMIGGAILAIPTTVIVLLVGAFKSKSASAADSGDTIPG